MRTQRLLVRFCVALACLTPAFGQTWSGLGLTGNISLAGNWLLGAPANDGTADIVFTIPVLVHPPVIDTNSNFKSLTFDSVLPTLTVGNLSGATLTLQSSLTQKTTNPQTLAAPLTIGPGFRFLGNGTTPSTILNLTQTLTGAGGFTVDGKLDLQIGGGWNMSGALTVDPGAFLRFRGADFDFSNDITNNGTVEFGNGAGHTVNYRGVISGSGIVGVQGDTTLYGQNVYTGATVIGAAKLTIGAAGALPSGSAVALSNVTSVLDLNSHDLTIGDLEDGNAGIGGQVFLGTGTLTTGGNGASTTYTGVISGGGSLVKAGGGVMTLAGMSLYTGTTTVTNGTLQLGANTALPAGTNVVLNPDAGATARLDLNGHAQTIGTLTLGGASSTSQSSVRFEEGTLTLGGTVTYDGSTRPEGATLGTLSDSGTILLGGGATFDIGASSTAEGNGWDVSVGVALGGNGNLLKKGAGTLLLGGDITYSGETVINDGTLRFDSTAAIKNATNVVIAAQAQDGAATVDFGGGTQTIGALTLAGASGSTNNVDLGPHGKLTLGGDVRYDAGNAPGAARIFNGDALDLGATTRTFTVDKSSTDEAELTVSTPIQGSVGLTKAGAGTMLLAATNTYTGPTTVNAGTLQIGDGWDGMIAGDLANHAEVIFNRADNPSYSGAISGEGRITVNGSITFAGANTYTGNTTINNGATLTVTNATPSGTGTGTVFVNSGATLQIGDGGANGSVAGNINNQGAVYIDLDGNSTYAGVISGAGRLELDGSGIYTLSGANTLSGDTVVTNGTLADGADNAFSANSGLFLRGSNAAVQVKHNETVRGLGGLLDSVGTTTSLASGTTLTLTTNGLTYAGQITGGGAIVLTGGGSQTFAGASDYSGGTDIKSGTLVVTNTSGSATGTGLVTVEAGGRLQFGQDSSGGAVAGNILNNGTVAFASTDDTAVYAGVISGAGRLNVGTSFGSGMLTLTGANTYTGQTNLLSGTLRIGAVNTLPTGTLVNGNGGTLDVAYNQQIGALVGGNSGGGITLENGAVLTIGSGGGEYDGSINGVGGLALNGGTNSLTLTGENNFSGGTNIVSGTLLATSYALGSGNVTVQAGAGFGNPGFYGSNPISNPIVLASGAHLIGGGNDSALQLSGNVTVPATSGTVNVTGTVALFGPLQAASGTTALTFGTVGPDRGRTVLFGPTDSSVTSITANGGAVVFGSQDALPAGLSIAATSGYVGLGARNGFTAPTFASLLNAIPNKASFAGGLGFDTLDTESASAVFHDAIDLSGFANVPSIGSTSVAVIDGVITVPTGADFHFGNGGGVLAVESTLSGDHGLTVASASAGDDATAVILRDGAAAVSNSFTGGVTVTNGALILDSATALPASTKIALGSNGYVGTTEAFNVDGGVTFQDLLGRISSVAADGTSIVGLDSDAAISDALARGSMFFITDARYVNDTIDLRGFDSVSLGTMTAALLSGEILGPRNGNLTLVSAANSGALVVGSNIHNGSASQVTIGLPNFGDDQSLVFLDAHNSYTGGTTLNKGTLVILGSSTKENGRIIAGPFGTGTVTVAPTAKNVTLMSVVPGQVLHNDFVLGSSLTLSDLSGLLSLVRAEISESRSDSYGFELNGSISGPGGLTVSESTLLTGSNSFSGGVNLVGGWSGASLTLGTDTALGTGTLTIGDPADETSVFGLGTINGDHTFANNLTFTGPSGVELSIAGSGNITFTHPVALNTESVDLNVSNFPVVFTNTISGFGELQVDGGAPVFVEAAGNTYSGGTSANDGLLIFGSTDSIPVAGQLVASDSGYIGLASMPANPADLQAKFINRFDKRGTNGTIGFDTLPNADMTRFNGNIDLAGFGSGVRLGSATAAEIAGTISPQGGSEWSDYYFGGGGGTLLVSSPLVDRNSEFSRNLELSSDADHPLTLRLSGTNTYTGETRVEQSALVFMSPAALHGDPMTLGGDLCLDLGGYIGLSLSSSATDASTDANVKTFLGRFDETSGGSYIGFEAPTGGRITEVDLSRYSSTGVGLATTTTLEVGGNLTIAADSNYSFAGYKGGQLTVSSVLSGGGSVEIGNTEVPATFGDPNNPTRISGVTLNGDNEDLSADINLNAGNLIVGHDHALGSGTLQVAYGIGDETRGIRPGLFANGTITLENPIHVESDLNLGGDGSLTLNGSVYVDSNIDLYKVGTGLLKLAGSNSFASSNEIYIQGGTVEFATSDSIGEASLQFGRVTGGTPTAVFDDDATVSGIAGDNAADTIQLTGHRFTVNQDFNAQFQGGIIGPTSGVTLQGGGQLELGGSSTFTGPATISDLVVVAANNNALGASTNPISLTDEGTLAVTAGTTLSNPITVTNGTLGGLGTFKVPTGSPGFTVGAGVTLAPALNRAGALTFDGSLISTSALILAGGGTYHWDMQDAAPGTGQWDQILVTGTVTITADTVNPFNFTMDSVAADGFEGYAANFDPTKSYSWAVLSTTNGILGFTGASQFNLTGSLLNNINIGPNSGVFSLSLNDTQTALMLNFTPVPEPSTYLLMTVGLGLVAFTLRRRRRNP